ncbi:MAG: HAD family hydrolase [Treponema sp.]|nr:HAD family hydrolase [Treponema sp.]
MKIYKIPENLRTLIFDIDSTLYTSPAYAHEQVDCQVRHFAELRGMTHEEARNLVADFRKKWASEHNGQKISLGNLLTYFDIPIEESIEWRKTLLEPADFLSRDEKLISALTELQKKYRLICVTNNPVLPARKTLDAVGVSEFFPEIIGLDTCHVSKPHEKPFLLAAEKTGAKPEECLSIGDRYDIDLSLPLNLGMGGILVSGVEDVWRLPEVL